MNEPRLPPIFRAVPLQGGDTFAWALAHAAEEGAATLAWCVRDGRLDCAVVMEPDQATDVARTVLFAAMLALGDALGAIGPPTVPLLFDWPNRIELNGGVVARFRVGTGPETEGVPSWLVVGASVDLGPDDGPEDAPGRDPGRTTLREEGFGAVDAAELLEAYARHLLSWVTCWLDDGFEVVRAHWMARWDAAAKGAGSIDAAGALLPADGERVPLAAGLGAEYGEA